MTRLTFCGAAGTVTGSCSMIETGSVRFLVDCGMFQGNRTIRALNREPFPFDPASVDFLLVTHAHIDHSGLVPKLVKHGFRGPIYGTAPTLDLLESMLLDSASIQESDAERRNRHLRRKGRPELEPVYTAEDATRALRLMKPVDYGEWLDPAGDVRARFWNAGHILGSSSIELSIDASGADGRLRLLFSGDLGPDEKAFHPDPDAPEGFDYVVCESTYGARERDDYTLAERREALRVQLVEGLERGGNVVIPSFAVERSQELLHDIGVLLSRGEIPRATVYLDSPLARKVTEVFCEHQAVLSEVDVDERELFRNRDFRIVQSVDESKAINGVQGGAIILSASGMCDAGRIQHHLKNNLGNPKATVLFVGYQAPGSLGRYLQDGAKHVRIHGREYPVRARVCRIGNYSAHADQGELAAWILERRPVVGGLFFNHGEDDARRALRDLLVSSGFEAERIFLPRFDESFELVAGTATSKGRVAERVQEDELERDWHNDYVAFRIGLSERLQGTNDPAELHALFQRLREVLDT